MSVHPQGETTRIRFRLSIVPTVRGAGPRYSCSYGLQGPVAAGCPGPWSSPCHGPARAIDLLCGVNSWGFPAGRKGSVSMIVRLHYADGSVENHPLENGVHFADYIRVVDVPGFEARLRPPRPAAPLPRDRSQEEGYDRSHRAGQRPRPDRADRRCRDGQGRGQGEVVGGRLRNGTGNKFPESSRPLSVARSPDLATRRTEGLQSLGPSGRPSVPLTAERKPRARRGDLRVPAHGGVGRPPPNEAPAVLGAHRAPYQNCCSCSKPDP